MPRGAVIAQEKETSVRVLPLLVAAAAIASGQTGLEILKRGAQPDQSLKSYHFQTQAVTEMVSESNG